MQQCRLCGISPVGASGEVCQECYRKAEFQPKATLVLEGSEHYDWGITKLTSGTINHVPQDSIVVGTWTKLGEGTYWVMLMEPITAIKDRYTLLALEVARRRAEGLPLIVITRVKPQRLQKRALPEPPSKPSMFDDLRAKLSSG